MKEAYALITGAGSGMGKQFALQLAAKGYPLLLVGRTLSKLEETARKAQSDYEVETHCIGMDMAEDNAPQRLYDTCREQQWEVEILINNAGIFVVDEFVKTAPEKLQQMDHLFVNTPTMLARLFGEDMKQRAYGHMLFVSSLTAYTPYPVIAVYNASKRYLLQFSRSLREEMKAYGVNVSCLLPGGVNTGLFHLESRYISLAARLGILMSAEKVVQKSLKKMFRKKARFMPGFGYRLLTGFLCLLPSPLIGFVYRHTPLLHVHME